MAYANKFPTSMKKGGMKKYVKGGPFDPKSLGTGKLIELGRELYNKFKGKSSSKSVDTPIKNYNASPKEKISSVPKAKKGGSINKTAGKTTTGVVSDYKGYKGPKAKAQVAKVKKSGKL